MKAFSCGITKKDFVSELVKHQAADAFTRGRYWDGKKGCAVGCSLRSVANLQATDFSNYGLHGLYETHLGIPEWLARVEDTLFEGMSLEKSKTWPVKFAEVIQPGADLNKIKVPFLVVLMKHSLKSISSPEFLRGRMPASLARITHCQEAVKQMIKVLPKGNAKAIEAARQECRDAAADYANYAAAAAYAAATAADAANAAAAAYAAATAAATAADAANAAAGTGAYDYYASELLKLMASVKGSGSKHAATAGKKIKKRKDK